MYLFINAFMYYLYNVYNVDCIIIIYSFCSPLNVMYWSMLLRETDKWKQMTFTCAAPANLEDKDWIARFYHQESIHSLFLSTEIDCRQSNVLFKRNMKELAWNKTLKGVIGCPFSTSRFDSLESKWKVYNTLWLKLLNGSVKNTFFTLSKSAVFSKPF